MKKISVVIFIHELQHYRVPIFNILSDHVDLTIVCSGDIDKFNGVKFQLKKARLYNIGPFIIHDVKSLTLARKNDVVISLFNIRCLDMIFLSILPFKSYSFIYWGIGVTASYSKRFDTKDISSFFRKFFSRFADALVFYSDYPMKTYSKIRKKKSMFVANNTVENKEYFISTVLKDRILFVGTLYPEKGVMQLIDQYYLAYCFLDGDIFPLDIVGDGPQRNEIQEKIYSLGLSDHVFLHGAIYDSNVLFNFYKHAVVSVSPNQAGLSVLSSMSNAVPFITCEDAITGGEIFNISNGVNGVVYNKKTYLSDILIDVNKKPEVYYVMGERAREFYFKKRAPSDMAEGLLDAIKYVRHK